MADAARALAMPRPAPVTDALIALIVPALLWGGALVSQYGFGLAPCEMCYWQRWPHQAAIVLALFALALARRPAGRVLTVLAALAILISGLIGVFHAGVEWNWWDGLTRCAVLTPGGFDTLSAAPAPIVRCDEAQWRFLGVSLAGYNAVFSIGAALAILWLVGRSRQSEARA